MAMPKMADKVKGWVCDYFEKQLLPACYDVTSQLLTDIECPSFEEYVQMVHDAMCRNGDESNG